MPTRTSAFIAALLLINAVAIAQENIVPYVPGDPVPDESGVVLMSFGPSEIAKLAHRLTIKNVKTGQVYFLAEPYVRVTANPENRFTHHVFVLPAGRYYVAGARTDIYIHNDLEVSRKDANFEVLPQTINYAGYWNFGRHQLSEKTNIYREISVTFEKEPLLFLYEHYQDLVTSYPVAISELGKPARKVRDQDAEPPPVESLTKVQRQTAPGFNNIAINQPWPGLARGS